MTFISYAQNYEDVMLWRALKHVQNGFYIDVGAACPDEHSVTKAFYLSGWRGINIELNPQFNQLLLKQRSEDKNLAVALGDKTGQVLMKLIKDTGLSIISSQIAEEHIASGSQIQEQEVELNTLADICKRHKSASQEIHFLKVDVEALEEAVLRGNDWSQYRPWVVVVEATLPMSQVESYASWEPILLAANYQFAYADGLNRFYVANEHAELLEAFKYSPNVFDGFLLGTQQKAESKAQQAESKAQQAEAASTQLLKQLQSVYASTSWRVTAPMRSLGAMAKHLSPKQLQPRIKLFLKHSALYVNRRPTLRRVTHAFLSRLPTLKHRLAGFAYGHSSQPMAMRNVPKELADLTPRARQIYADLKTAIQNNQKSN